ncbi:MAG: hypothetical protein COT25_00890, partial [Candidatus Kerfeldbacteria bacterium CG08_land_8_20_14_0_20_42_7]
TFLYHAGFAYVDNAMLFFLTISLIWLFKYKDEKNRYMLWLSACSLIAVATTKYAGGLWGIPLVAVLSQNARKTSLRKWLADILILSIPAMVGLGFWLFRNFLEVGYPFDPIGKIPLTSFSTSAKTIPEYLSSMFSLSSLSDCFNNLKNNASSLIPLFIVVASLLSALFRKKFSVLLALVLCLLVWKLMPPGNDFRYLLPAYPFMIVVGLYGLVGFLTKPAIKVFSVAIISLVVLSQLYAQRSYFRRILPYALGYKNIDQFKEDYFGNEPFMFNDFENKVKEKIGSKKLLVYGADLIYPAMEKFNLDYLSAVVNPYKINSFGDLKTKMVSKGYYFLLTNRATLVESFEKMKWEDDVDNYFRFIYKGSEPANDYYLYLVK